MLECKPIDEVEAKEDADDSVDDVGEADLRDELLEALIDDEDDDGGDEDDPEYEYEEDDSINGGWVVFFVVVHITVLISAPAAAVAIPVGGNDKHETEESFDDEDGDKSVGSETKKQSRNRDESTSPAIMKLLFLLQCMKVIACFIL